PVRAVDQQQIAKLIADLDSEWFADREKAARELEKLGDLAETALRKVLQRQPRLEMRRRVEQLLEKLEKRVLDSETLRSARALETLERIGTEGAKQIAESLSQGARGSWLTEDARATLARLNKR